MTQLQDDEQKALSAALEANRALEAAWRAHRARKEEREAYERTGVLPKRMRRLALRILKDVTG